MKNFILIMLLIAGTSGFAAQSPRAFQISDKNILQLDRSGPSAIAGKGDWWLSNGHLCVAVSGLKHDAGIVAGGGSLIDIGHCGRGNDQWLNNNILTGMAKDDALQAQAITTESDQNSATIVVSGEKDGIRQILRYSLSTASNRLRMEVVQQRVGKGAKLGMSAVLTLHPSGSLTPFSYSADRDDNGRGFRSAQVDNNNILSMLEAMTAADTAYLLGNDNESPAISYRVRLTEATLTNGRGVRKALPKFQLTVEDYTMLGWMTRPTWIGSGYPGLIMFSQMPFMDLRQGELLSAVFHIDVVDTTDVDGFPPAGEEGLYQLSGNTAAGSVIAVYRDTGEAVTQTTADSSGRYTVALPEASTYQFDVSTPAGMSRRETVKVAAPVTVADIPFTASGRLALPAGEVMQLTITGRNGTPHPVLRGGRSMLRIEGEFGPGSLRGRDIALTGSADDLRFIDLPPGDYRVLASRGLDFGVNVADITVQSGSEQQLAIKAPLRQVLAGNVISADFHVHSSVSFDSTIPRRDQLKRFVAAGADVLVFTEHNRIAAPAAAADLPLQLINGLEYTGTARTVEAPTTIGHSNVFPVSFDPKAHRGGSPRVEASSLREVQERSRIQWPQALFQLNHPRSPHPNDADLAFFSHLSRGVSFDPDRALTEGDNALLLAATAGGTRDIDFDLIEVLNGSEIDVYERVRRDWFALLGAGFRKVATANSDSHAWKTPLGIPVNRISISDASLPVPEATLLDAIKAGRMYGTSGPSLAVALSTDKGATRLAPGDTCVCTEAELQLTIAAADWIDTDTIMVFVGGQALHTQRINGPGSYTVPLRFAQDSFVVVEVSGTPGEIYRTLYPGYTPVAFSNPVYIDADANGEWTP